MVQNDQQDEFSYRYFTLGQNNPVRVKLNAEGQEVNAEVPDPETQKLKIQTTMLSRLAVSPDTQEITSDTFNRMCQDVYSQKKSFNGGAMRLSL